MIPEGSIVSDFAAGPDSTGRLGVAGLGPRHFLVWVVRCESAECPRRWLLLGGMFACSLGCQMDRTHAYDVIHSMRSTAAGKNAKPLGTEAIYHRATDQRVCGLVFTAVEYFFLCACRCGAPVHRDTGQEESS
ncbi:hypothetical protein P8C59_005821 [Phyllachora maydis]|uniref:Uncharacterized protein n=1 Tax=Phyllachora maydis TaxID=1825666 RepID=A0AAD9I6W1_9PEZI|nr:hypothetical protein P8C59_005821 [Phyllachora maydis]